MKNYSTNLLVFVLAVLSCVAGVADAQQLSSPDAKDPVRVNLALKIYPNSVDGVFASLLETTSGVVPVANYASTADETTFLPAISVRYKDLLFSASHLARTKYVATSGSGTVEVKRSETDVNFGYYVLPQLALSLGYKELKSDVPAPFSSLTLRGPTVGLAISAPLGPNFGAYGTFAYGRLHPDYSPAISVVGNSSYVSSEIGLAYTLGSWTQGFVKAVNLTGGYRFQNIETRRTVPVASVVFPATGLPTVVGTESKRVTAVSRGWIAGIVVSF